MFEGLSKSQLLSKARDAFKDAVSGDVNFIQEALVAFDFERGDQWTAEERQILDDEKRPCLTYNLIRPAIDLIMGMNEETKIRYYPYPVERNDGFLAEILGQIADWCEDNFGISNEEDDAFRTSSICGRGWVGLDFAWNAKTAGHLNINGQSISPLDVKMDPACRKNDLSDASYICIDKWLTLEDFKIRYPKHAKHAETVMEEGMMLGDIVLTPEGEQNIFEVSQDYLVDDESAYTKALDIDFYDRTKRRVRVVQMEYWQTYTRYYYFDYENGQVEELTKEQVDALKVLYPQVHGIPFEYETALDKRVMWLHFVGDKILYHGPSMLPYEGFSPVPCFGYSDTSKRTNRHYGVVKPMIDPQREVNKRWSQALNYLNKQVQPGLLAEMTAFVDSRQAEESMRTAGSITWLNDGAINQKKIQERSVPQFPIAPIQLHELSQDLIRKVSGINPDLLGQDRGREEAGVVIRLRQQQGTTLLKPLFKNYKTMKRGVYERLLSIIMAYMPEDQMLQIVGSNGKYVIENGIIIDTESGMQADIRDVRNLKYNIKMEEIPGNQTRRLMELQVYIEMMQYGFPVDPEVVIDKMDISATEKQRWIQYIQQQQAKQEEMAKNELQLKMLEIESKREQELTKAQIDKEIDMAKLGVQDRKADQKNLVDIAKLQNEKRRQELDFIARTAEANEAPRPA